MEPKVYLRHIENEEVHWWFKARRAIIYSIIKNNINFESKKINILDYGAGSGTNIGMLNKFGYVHVYEKDEKTSRFLKEKFKKYENIKIIQKPNNNNNKEFFDLILIADVIEHVEDDMAILQYLSELLNKKGQILITVPAFDFLFSNKDKVLRHYRRYNKKNIKKIISKYFNITKLSYYNFFLFIPLAIYIICSKIFRVNFIDFVEKKPNIILNSILFQIFHSEKFLLNFLNFPFGLSLIVLAKKKIY
jgi:SAM-dependent methyltransferase